MHLPSTSFTITLYVEYNYPLRNSILLSTWIFCYLRDVYYYKLHVMCDVLILYEINKHLHHIIYMYIYVALFEVGAHASRILRARTAVPGHASFPEVGWHLPRASPPARTRPRAHGSASRCQSEVCAVRQHVVFP